MPKIRIKRVKALAGYAVAITVAYLMLLVGFDYRATFAAGTLVLMAWWWFTESLPVHWVAALPIVFLFGITGNGLAADAALLRASYLDPYVFLFLGGMVIAAAFQTTKLDRRIALTIIRMGGTSPAKLLFGVLAATALVSSWISNTATTAMMLPIVVALAGEVTGRAVGKDSAGYVAALMLAVPYGANIGGISTPVGTATNSVLIGHAATILGYDISFMQYMAMGVPFVVVFVVLVWALLWWRLGRQEETSRFRGAETVAHEIGKLGSMGTRERMVALVAGSAGMLWVLGGVLRPIVAPHLVALTGITPFEAKHYEASVAMLGAVAVVAGKLVSWKSLKNVQFNTLLLIGGSFALARGIEASGLSAVVAGLLQVLQVLPFAVQAGIVAVVSVLLTMIASNTAALTVLLNVLPKPQSLPILSIATIGASCDFALPAGTPPNAMAAAYVSPRTMMRAGLPLDVLAMVALTLYVHYLQYVF